MVPVAYINGQLYSAGGYAHPESLHFRNISAEQLLADIAAPRGGKYLVPLEIEPSQTPEPRPVPQVLLDGDWRERLEQLRGRTSE